MQVEISGTYLRPKLDLRISAHINRLFYQRYIQPMATVLPLVAKIITSKYPGYHMSTSN